MALRAISKVALEAIGHVVRISKRAVFLLNNERPNLFMKPTALLKIHREPAESEKHFAYKQSGDTLFIHIIHCRIVAVRCLIPVLAALLLAVGANAQDPGFSQFFASPLTLNPALTGKFNGVVRVAGNYRNQWPSINNAFITSTISVDAPILRNKLPENDTWGLGLMGMNDKTAGGALNSNYIALSTAYHKSLDEDGYHQLGVGFQGSYASQTLDGTQLHFEDQLDLNGGWTLPSNEAISNRVVSIHYFDMNLGVLYNASTNGNNNYYVGASAYHLNHPKQSFLGVDTVNVPTRITLHGGGYFPITGSPSTIYVSALFNNQAGSREYVMGGAWAVNASNDETNPVNFYAGLWGRFTNNTTDAVIPYVGLDYSDFSLGVTYDVNVSTLKTASQSRGGIEISLIYIKKPSNGRKAVPCPKF
jgi:type IX secretion system PorP/SprF family membrane protein